MSERGCPVFVEREPELTAMTRIAAAVPHSGAHLLLVTGEAGAGKSRLIREFVATLPEEWTVTSTAIDELTPGGAAPVAALLEDVHDLEASQVVELKAVLDKLRHTPALIIASYRLGSHGFGGQHLKALAAALREPNASELRLAPLSPVGVAAMANAMRADTDDAFVSDLYRRTGGNPFFVEEILRSPDASIPGSVSDVVAARLEALGPAAVQVAAILAAAREPVALDIIDALVVDADSAAGALVSAALAEDLDGTHLALKHALVGESVETLAGWSEVHRRLAETLEERPGTAPERIARHWDAAGDPARAARWARLAATRAAGRHAYRKALELYELAAATPPEEPAERAELFRHAAASAAAAGDVGRAIAWGEAAAVAYEEAGQPHASHELWGDPHLKYLPNPRLGSRPTETGDAHDLEAAWLQLQHAQAGGDPEATAGAAVALALWGEFATARRVLRAGRDEAVAHRRPIDAARRCGDLARAAAAAGDVEQATVEFRAAVTEARRESESQYWLIAQTALAIWLAKRGDLEEAELLASEVNDPSQGVLAAYGEVPLAMIETERGELASARRRLDFITPLAVATGQDFIVLTVLSAGAALEVADRCHGRALEAVAQARSVAKGLLYDEWPDVLVLWAEAAAAAGDRRGLKTAATEAAELARVATGPGVQAAADAIEGHLAAARGEWADAASRFEAAARAWERTPRWCLAARAWCDAAESDLRIGGRSATAALDAAAAIADRLALAPIADRISRLRAAAPEGGAPELDALSSRELEILRLLATGATNAEIADRLYVSQSTTSHLVSALYSKLGVSRRSEAAAVAVKAGLAAS